MGYRWMHRRAALVLSVALGLAIAAPVPSGTAGPLPPGGTFADDDGNVHEGSIEAIAAADITHGCSSRTDLFCPNDPVSRGQMAAFLNRALGLPTATRDYFVDDDTSIFESDINRLAEAGITKGCDPPDADRFCPATSVTRGVMAAFLVRTYGYTAGSDSNAFVDDDGSVFEADINRLAAAGITVGCNPPLNDRFCPAGVVTRAQMASFLARAAGLSPMVPSPRPAPDPPIGNPDGHAAIPTGAGEVDTTGADIVIGDGTPQSCTSDAVVAAVAEGGVIVFDCGPEDITITMTTTAKVFNNTGPEIVIDGGGKVTLNGGGAVRILYMNTCDFNQIWTTSHCQDQDHPRLTVQNLTFIEGNATGEDPDGGGAIFVRGGRFKIVNSRFFNNVCDSVGPDVGGAAVRVLSQYNDLPVYVVNSTFGGADGLGNVCSNGGGLSSIGVSWTVINSLFTHNDAIGNGANPAGGGTPGGGSGGAIYNDGNTFTLTLRGTRIEDNHANEGGGAVFFVSNDRSGSLVIGDSVLRRNPSDQFETAGLPGIFVLANGPPLITNSIIE